MIELADKLIKSGYFLESIKLTTKEVDLTFRTSIEYFQFETIQNIIGDRQYKIYGEMGWVHLVVSAHRKTKFINGHF
jgi:hypothetical protein